MKYAKGPERHKDAKVKNERCEGKGSGGEVVKRDEREKTTDFNAEDGGSVPGEKESRVLKTGWEIYK